MSDLSKANSFSKTKLKPRLKLFHTLCHISAWNCFHLKLFFVKNKDIWTWKLFRVFCTKNVSKVFESKDTENANREVSQPTRIRMSRKLRGEVWERGVLKGLLGKFEKWSNNKIGDPLLDHPTQNLPKTLRNPNLPGLKTSMHLWKERFSKL